MVFETCITDDGHTYRICITSCVYLRFDNERSLFNITSKDGNPLLTDKIENKLKEKDWKYYQDGHGGLYVWIAAPVFNQDELEAILMLRRS
jgi:hypothetical protein